MKAKATFLSYISAEKRLRKEQSKVKSNAGKTNVEQVSHMEKRALAGASN